MERKPIRSKSVLKRQKPHGKSRRKTLKIGVIGSIVLLTATAVAFVWTSNQTDPHNRKLSKFENFAKNKGYIPWRIDVKNEGKDALEPALLVDIQALIQKSLQVESSPDLKLLAQNISQRGSFASVRLVKLGTKTLVAQVTPRTSRLCVEADQIRYIGTDGAIYGSPNPSESCPGPILKGMFETGRKFQFNRDATLTLSQEELNIASQCLALMEALQTAQLSPSTINYAKFRGFIVTLQGSSTEISLGFPPFEGRLQKLSQLLERIATSGSEALRIELDYQGKAFVKLKKI